MIDALEKKPEGRAIPTKVKQTGWSPTRATTAKVESSISIILYHCQAPWLEY